MTNITSGHTGGAPLSIGGPIHPIGGGPLLPHQKTIVQPSTFESAVEKAQKQLACLLQHAIHLSTVAKI